MILLMVVMLPLLLLLRPPSRSAPVAMEAVE
jgi:hypothetical protein